MFNTLSNVDNSANTIAQHLFSPSSNDTVETKLCVIDYARYNYVIFLCTKELTAS